MIEVCCQCDEGFGVSHLHRRFLKVRRQSDGLVIPHASGFLPEHNPGWDVLEDYEYLLIAVDWPRVARELARNA